MTRAHHKLLKNMTRAHHKLLKNMTRAHRCLFILSANAKLTKLTITP